MLSYFKSGRTFATASVWLIMAAGGRGDVVNFGDSSNGPTNMLSLGGVTITSASWGPAGEPGTVAGVGLGSGTFGALSSLDRRMHFVAGEFVYDEDLQEGLTLSVNGRINSLVLAPYFSVIGAAVSPQLPFQVMLYPQAHAPGALTPGPLMPSWESFASPFPATVTVSNMFLWDDFSSLVITMAGSDPTTGFFPYLDGNGFPDVTFEFGVQILSLDFTPVPEPAAASLVVIGLLLFGMRHRLGRKN